MFEFFKKKHKVPNNPKGNNDDTETLEAPDALNAIDSIDAALKEADRIRDNEERAKLYREATRGGCGCGGR